jgi:hypothetical protein
MEVIEELEYRNDQKRIIEEIFSKSLYAPMFRPNTKYCTGEHAKNYGYISLDDVINYRYIIRIVPGDIKWDPFYFEKHEILAEYDGADALVDDGWRLST